MDIASIDEDFCEFFNRLWIDIASKNNSPSLPFSHKIIRRFLRASEWSLAFYFDETFCKSNDGIIINNFIAIGRKVECIDKQFIRSVTDPKFPKIQSKNWVDKSCLAIHQSS